jgi:hypothetical protein
MERMTDDDVIAGLTPLSLISRLLSHLPPLRAVLLL